MARSEFERIGAAVEVAQCDQNAGVVLKGMGRRTEALEAYAAAHAVYAEQGMAPEAAKCRHSVANILQALDRQKEALDIVLEARDRV